MIREEFRVLCVDLGTGKGSIKLLDGRNLVAGGSGLAALLYDRFGNNDLSWDDAAQPLIFAIGPLTGCFPLMSKTVCAFRSAYHHQYTESHAGGRLAHALRFADLDALVITGRAGRLSCLVVGGRHLEVRDVDFMRGLEADASGKLLRRMFARGPGHRSILRIGPAGEIGLAMACINVDSYRHFGRMGGGAVMGVKNLKGIVVQGDGDFAGPAGNAYAKVFKEVYGQATSTDMMRKYYNLGTAVNLQGLNDLQSLPWNNLQKTCDPAIAGITGEAFADETLLRNGACSGCPVGCIHIGYVREKTQQDNRYHYHQVAYDYEPIFAAGTMLGVTKPFDVLRILDVMDKVCLDAMSGGVALAWATEASERGLVSEKETVVRLKFGDAVAYRQAAEYLGRGINDFYRLLGMGTLRAAAAYGGGEFACVLGQEMAGYATGELFFAAQTLGFRHSHLDTGAYSYDQKNARRDVGQAVDFLVADEPGRVFLTSMVACLFARSVYTDTRLAECLAAVGFDTLAGSIPEVAEHVRRLRWQARIATGFDPAALTIPKRFYDVRTWKGPVSREYLDALKQEYGRRIMELTAAGPQSSEGS